MVADVLPTGSGQVQFTLTYTLVQSLLKAISMVKVMVVVIWCPHTHTHTTHTRSFNHFYKVDDDDSIIMMTMMIMMLYLCTKERHGSRKEDVQELENVLIESIFEGGKKIYIGWIRCGIWNISIDACSNWKLQLWHYMCYKENSPTQPKSVIFWSLSKGEAFPIQKLLLQWGR